MSTNKSRKKAAQSKAAIAALLGDADMWFEAMMEYRRSFMEPYQVNGLIGRHVVVKLT